MDALTVYGFTAVASMLAFYALEKRHPAFILAFAASCVASAVYGFLADAWPFGVVETIWAGVATVRWRNTHV
jgi:hypothetical protein